MLIRVAAGIMLGALLVQWVTSSNLLVLLYFLFASLILLLYGFYVFLSGLFSGFINVLPGVIDTSAKILAPDQKSAERFGSDKNGGGGSREYTGRDSSTQVSGDLSEETIQPLYEKYGGGRIEGSVSQDDVTVSREDLFDDLSQTDTVEDVDVVALTMLYAHSRAQTDTVEDVDVLDPYDPGEDADIEDLIEDIEEEGDRWKT